MRVLLFLLLALSTPAGHHVPTLPPEMHTLAVERAAANAERAMASWTKWLAIWTGAMAGATFLAVFVPLLLRWKDRRDASSAAMRDLYQIASVFKTRADKLAREPSFSAAALLEGLDVLLTRALSDDIARALPNTTDTSYVYSAMFTAYDALSDALHYQAPENSIYAAKSRDMAVASSVMLNRCMVALTTELKRRKAEWKTSDIGTWLGTTNQRDEATREPTTCKAFAHLYCDHIGGRLASDAPPEHRTSSLVRGWAQTASHTARMQRIDDANHNGITNNCIRPR